MCKSSLSVVAGIALFIGGIIVGATCLNANAQVPVAKTTGSYKIAAHGEASDFGCFLVDTATGDVWHSSNGNSFHLVPKAKTVAEAK
jgi:hypothetical protein